MRLFLDAKSDHLFFGFSMLVIGIGLMPIMANLVLKIANRMNAWTFGTLYAWQDTMLSVFKVAAALFCVAIAASGAILLALAAVVSAELLKSPWQ